MSQHVYVMLGQRYRRDTSPPCPAHDRLRVQGQRDVISSSISQMGEPSKYMFTASCDVQAM